MNERRESREPTAQAYIDWSDDLLEATIRKLADGTYLDYHQAVEELKRRAEIRQAEAAIKQAQAAVTLGKISAGIAAISALIALATVFVTAFKP